MDAERSVDPRNRLNDLTGREWVYALRSVISTRYPTSGPEAFAHHLRRLHPSPKPPQLMAELVRFFTKTGGHVLDPFAGVGGTLLACSMEGRTAVGVDLSPIYADCYVQVCATLNLPVQPYLVADARRLAELPELQRQPFDLILTDPPYAQMLAKERTGERKNAGRAILPLSPTRQTISAIWRIGPFSPPYARFCATPCRFCAHAAILCCSPKICNPPPNTTICSTPTSLRACANCLNLSFAAIASGMIRASTSTHSAIPTPLSPTRCTNSS